MNAEFNPDAIHRPVQAQRAVQVQPLERRRLQCYLAIMLGDVAMLLVGFLASGYLYLGSEGAWSGLVLGQLVLPVFLTIALYNNAYSLQTLLEPGYGIRRVLVALLISSAAVVFIAFYTKSSRDFSRVTFTLGIGMAGFLLLWCRVQMRALVGWRCGATVVNELIIDDGGPELRLGAAQRISAAQYGLVPDSADPAALDRIGLVLRNVDRVMVSCPPERRLAWSMIFKGAAIVGEVIDDTIVELGAKGARQQMAMACCSYRWGRWGCVRASSSACLMSSLPQQH